VEGGVGALMVFYVFTYWCIYPLPVGMVMHIICGADLCLCFSVHLLEKFGFVWMFVFVMVYPTRRMMNEVFGYRLV